MTDSESLDLLRRLGEELRAVFADERRAIATLDHARLTQLASTKADVLRALEDVRAKAPAAVLPHVELLFTAVRAEAHATAMLARAATEAVRALLGIEQMGYDRLARRTQAAAPRLLTTY